MLSGYDGRVYPAPERPSGEHAADWPAGAQASQREMKRSLLASAADCFAALPAGKSLGGDGFCHQGQTTPRSTGLDGDQIPLRFTPGLHYWHLMALTGWTRPTDRTVGMSEVGRVC